MNTFCKICLCLLVLAASMAVAHANETEPAGTVLFYNGNIGGVSSNPTRNTAFMLKGGAIITSITNYHYFNKGVLPGTIAIKDYYGKVYGPWQATGRTGQSGVANAYWDVVINTSLPPGIYTIVDSNGATWSHNGESGGAGFSWVRGDYTGINPGEKNTANTTTQTTPSVDTHKPTTTSTTPTPPELPESLTPTVSTEKPTTPTPTASSGDEKPTTLATSNNVSITYDGMDSGAGDLVGDYQFSPNGQYDCVYSLNVNLNHEKIDYISITDTRTAATNYWYSKTQGNAWLLALYQNGTLLNPERKMTTQVFNGNTSFVLHAHDNGSIKAGGRFKVTIVTDKTTYTQEFDVAANKTYAGSTTAATLAPTAPVDITKPTAPSTASTGDEKSTPTDIPKPTTPTTTLPEPPTSTPTTASGGNKPTTTPPEPLTPTQTASTDKTPSTTTQTTSGAEQGGYWVLKDTVTEARQDNDNPLIKTVWTKKQDGIYSVRRIQVVSATPAV